MSVNQHWVSRIGEPAAWQIARGLTVQRTGATLSLLFVALEIGFQLDNYYRPGIIAAVPLFVLGMSCLFYSQKYYAVARRLIAQQVGLPANQAKYIPVSRGGIPDFDRWYAARGKPGWPVKGWR